MTRLAALLRRLADRLDPPAPTARDTATDDAEAVPEFGPLTVVRERQEERLRELEYLIGRLRDHDDGAGFLWLETWQLEALKKYLEHELRLRERRFDLVEKHWRP